MRPPRGRSARRKIARMMVRRLIQEQLSRRPNRSHRREVLAEDPDLLVPLIPPREHARSEHMIDRTDVTIPMRTSVVAVDM